MTIAPIVEHVGGMEHPHVYSPDDLAERWGCSGETVRNMIRSGELPAFRVGRMYRIRWQDVDRHERCERDSE
ncbi:helix-turn-helix domain-containing protein [Salipiger thiooxidans]|uniref:helix-turn-helix domain-containing protein n=1 Tax=Salipiger thiooxidans TaxID=282683 RepID=UPI001CD1B997|nr:helix-turn-helix domain-containing protein [Salipiger thiooxidans]MCA0847204.1 helix-turn-helix domain-containing protein [Salipiger thiooxidans]